MIQCCLLTDQKERTTATQCLESPWLHEAKTMHGDQSGGISQVTRRQCSISSMHLCDLVRRRMKKLNSVAPLLLAPSPSRIPRPESLYR